MAAKYTHVKAVPNTIQRLFHKERSPLYRSMQYLLQSSSTLHFEQQSTVSTVCGRTSRTVMHHHLGPYRVRQVVIYPTHAKLFSIRQHVFEGQFLILTSPNGQSVPVNNSKKQRQALTSYFECNAYLLRGVKKYYGITVIS